MTDTLTVFDLARAQQFASSPCATALPIACVSGIAATMPHRGDNAAPACRSVLLHAPFFIRLLALIVLLLASTLSWAEGQRVRVGVVMDGPSDREMFSVEGIQREVANVIATDLGSERSDMYLRPCVCAGVDHSRPSDFSR